MKKTSTGAQSSGYQKNAPSVVKSKKTSTRGSTDAKNVFKTFSLKAALSEETVIVSDYPNSDYEKNAEHVDEYIDPSWNNTVSQDSLKQEWLNYMVQMQEKHPRLASILKNHQPILHNGTVLSVKLKNVTQEKELIAEKSKLLPYLKRKLKNAHLQLEAKVVIDEQGEQKKAYTAAERAKLMLEKNPSLLSLSKKFDLDVEI